MEELHDEAQRFIRDEVSDEELKRSLTAYLDFVIKRNI